MHFSSKALIAFCVAAALAPVPALSREQGRAGDLAEKLDDPVTQYAVAGMLSAMSKAVLEMRVEPIVKAVEGIGGGMMRDLPPDATVADLAGTDHGQVRDEIVSNVPKAMSAMGAVAGSVQDMLPELEKMARKVRDATAGM